MTVEPIQGGSNGDIVDFNVSHTGHSYQTQDDEYVFDSQGQSHHVYENVTLNEEDVAPDVNQDILDGIQMEYPNLEAATQWAAQYGILSNDEIIAWNRALELNPEDGFGAIDAIHQQAQSLLEKFEQFGGANPETGEQETDYDIEEDEEEVNYTEEELETFNSYDDAGLIDDTLDTLTNDYSFNEDQVSYMESLLDDGDCSEIENDMLSLGIAVANGSLTMEEAIETFTDAYGDVQAVNQFFLTQQNYNPYH